MISDARQDLRTISGSNALVAKYIAIYFGAMAEYYLDRYFKHKGIA